MTPDEMKELRAKLGMSQREFAKALNVQPNAIFSWEGGHTPIDARTAMAANLLLLAKEPSEAARIVKELQARVGIVGEEDIEGGE
jgi:DNA-binding transcriptional regulator YiaG